MRAGGGGLAAGEEAGDAGAPVEVGRGPAHVVVGRGRDGDGAGGEVMAALEAAGADAGEAPADEVGAAMGDVEPDAVAAVAAHRLRDGFGDDAAGGELGVGVDAGHEAVAAGVEQDRALAAEGFGNEEGGAVAGDERGGVELHELDVADDRAGAEREAESVGGGAGRIGRVAVEGAGAAGGEDRRAGLDRRRFAGGVFDHRAGAAAGVDDQLARPRADAEIEAGLRRFGGECGLDVEARPVAAGVEHAVDGVRALAAERDRAVRRAVELDAEPDQAAHRRRALAREDADGSGVAEARAGADRVRRVAFGVVVRADRRGDAALRLIGVGARERRLRDDGDGAAFRGDQRGVESGQAAADDEDVDAAHRRLR